MNDQYLLSQTTEDDVTESTILSKELSSTLHWVSQDFPSHIPVTDAVKSMENGRAKSCNLFHSAAQSDITKDLFILQFVNNHFYVFTIFHKHIVCGNKFSGQNNEIKQKKKKKTFFQPAGAYFPFFLLTKFIFRFLITHFCSEA